MRIAADSSFSVEYCVEEYSLQENVIFLTQKAATLDTCAM
jgi:hypothetical protein